MQSKGVGCRASCQLNPALGTLREWFKIAGIPRWAQALGGISPETIRCPPRGKNKGEGGHNGNEERGWKPPQNMWLQRNAENIYKKKAWRAARCGLKENSAPHIETAQQP